MDGKICQNIKPPTPTHIPSLVQLSTWGRLGYKQFFNFLLYVNSFKKIFVSNKNVHFFIFTASKNIETHKIKFEVGFSYKDCI